MARQDIANMLTGMGGGSTRPNPNMSSSDWRMAFGAQQAQGLMNAAGTTTPQEAIQMGIGKLDLGTVKGLQTLGQMQQIRGDTEAAAKTASQIEAMKQKTKLEAQTKAETDKSVLRADSMALALTEAGHEELAKQVKLGDVAAYKRGLELISPEKGANTVEDLVDGATGITHKVLLSPSGTVVRTIGVSKMPELKSVTLPNGQLVWENGVTGTRGVPQDTPEALEQDKKRVAKLYSDLAAVDNVLTTVSEAKKLTEDVSMTTGVFYNLASMPFSTDARKLQTKITTLQSTLAFDRLQKMRDESKTGGALGQVSNIELQLLQSALTALDPVVGKEEFTKQLEKVQKHYTNFKKALLGEPLDIDWSRPEYEGKTTVVDGVRYMVDPADPTKAFAIGAE